MTKKIEETIDVSEENLNEEKLETGAGKESLEIELEKTTSKTEKSKISLEERKKELLKRAAELKEKKTDVLSSEELKEKVKAKKRADMLIDLEEYVKTGIYLGTRVVTPDMKKYVYRRRADGLAIFNTDLIDEKLKEGIEYLSKFKSEEVILVCKRQAGWKVAKKFGEITGIKVFTKKFPAGAMTNIELENFFETELTIIADQWLDKNALKDTLDVRKNVLMICGTNNFSKGADQIIIGNNKSGKSLGLIFYLLARGYLKSQNKDISVIPDIEWWTEDSE